MDILRVYAAFYACMTIPSKAPSYYIGKLWLFCPYILDRLCCLVSHTSACICIYL